MQIQPTRRLVSTATNPDEQHRIAVDLHESRQSLIAALLRLRPDYRAQVLKDQAPNIRRTRYWSYEGLEACCQRLRALEDEHSDPGLRRIVAQARESRRDMNRARESLIMANLGIVADVGACDPFKATLKDGLQEQITRLLGELNPRERRIIEMRFGFEDGKGRTLHQIAGLMGVSRERVRQIESGALDKMNRWAKRDRIVSC